MSHCPSNPTANNRCHKRSHPTYSVPTIPHFRKQNKTKRIKNAATSSSGSERSKTIPGCLSVPFSFLQIWLRIELTHSDRHTHWHTHRHVHTYFGNIVFPLLLLSIFCSPRVRILYKFYSAENFRFKMESSKSFWIFWIFTLVQIGIGIELN